VTRLRLSEHFLIEEFDCHDGTHVPRVAEPYVINLARRVLEPLRTQFGVVIVHSGYRDLAYNQRIGGARSSFHIYELRHGRYPAADVECGSGSVRDWHTFVDELQHKWSPPHGGLGFYPQGGFVHVDSRPYIARWDGS
jgi:uncharacterized protein YcbK (DUF882 family)